MMNRSAYAVPFDLEELPNLNEHDVNDICTASALAVSQPRFP